MSDAASVANPLPEFLDLAITAPPVAATDLGGNLQSPVYSPDGKWLAYYSGARRMVKKVSVTGGAALRVCEGLALSLEWDASGILVGRGADGVVRCNPAGGAPEQLATVDDGEIATAPQIWPMGTPVVYHREKIAWHLGPEWGYDVSPKDQIVFTRFNESRRELWLAQLK